MTSLKNQLQNDKTAQSADWRYVDRQIAAFEARRRLGSARIHDFLPDPGSREFRDTLVELLRVEFELAASAAGGRRLQEWLNEFPMLRADRQALTELTFEDWRCRIAGGGAVDPSEYASAFGVDTSSWPTSRAGLSGAPGTSSTVAFWDLAAVPTTEEISSAFPEFLILRILGEGSFATVALAEQRGLANRAVVLKVSRRFEHEADKLARLQHANIVPICSVHVSDGLCCLVMPFLGERTLAVDFLENRQPRNERDGLRLALSLAEGLAHAHARGLAHLDVKPANILLADNGDAMLLDFNLSHDLGAPARASVGGTPAYMSPEQLDVLAGNATALDARSDLFSLGIVLYEALLGRHPAANELRECINVRQRVEALRRWRPRVDHDLKNLGRGTRAILRKCLETSPANRFADASELAEDLRRERDSRPLVHSMPPSRIEGLSRWVHRHPRAVPTVALVTAAVCILSLALISLRARGRELAHNQAMLAHTAFFEKRQYARMLLGAPLPSDAELESGITKAISAFREFVDDPLGEFSASGRISRLNQAQSHEVMDASAELLFLLARAQRVSAMRADGTKRADLLESASRYSRRAMGLSPKIQFAAHMQQDVIRQLESSNSPAAPNDPSAKVPVTARDHFIHALEHFGRNDVRNAIRSLEKSIEIDPKDPAVWASLGHALFASGNTTEALAAFRTASALGPKTAEIRHMTAACLIKLTRYPEAVELLDESIALDPKYSPAWLDRGLARLFLREPQAALGDFTRGYELNPKHTRALWLRANAQDALGNRLAAAADRQAAARLEPGDEQSWVSRGVRKLTTDPRSALQDFAAALKGNPWSLDAIQNTAHVYAELLDDPAAGIAALDRAIELFPDYVPARSSRAVLHARTGNRDAALADVNASLAIDSSPATLYQLAGAYAQLTRTHPTDRSEAYTLLRRALSGGYGAQHLGTDPDLKRLRDEEEFQLIVKSVQQLQPLVNP